MVVKDLAIAERDGVDLGPPHGRIYPIVLGNKGDWSYLASCSNKWHFNAFWKIWLFGRLIFAHYILSKIDWLAKKLVSFSKSCLTQVSSANLERSYRRAPKGPGDNEGEGTVGSGVCHLCLCGQGMYGADWEDMSLRGRYAAKFFISFTVKLRYFCWLPMYSLYTFVFLIDDNYICKICRVLHWQYGTPPEVSFQAQVSVCSKEDCRRRDDIFLWGGTSPSMGSRICFYKAPSGGSGCEWQGQVSPDRPLAHVALGHWESMGGCWTDATPTVGLWVNSWQTICLHKCRIPSILQENQAGSHNSEAGYSFCWWWWLPGTEWIVEQSSSHHKHSVVLTRLHRKEWGHGLANRTASDLCFQIALDMGLVCLLIVCWGCLQRHSRYTFFKNNAPLYIGVSHSPIRFVFVFAEAFGTRKINDFMRGIYQNDFFIESATATALANDLRSFIRAYLWLAQYSYSKGVPSFPLLPKLHFLQEVAFTLARQARLAKFAINPAAHCCSMDEDFIGRTAAVSRCVSPKLMCRRTLERWLCHLQMAWSRVGVKWWKAEVGEDWVEVAWG